MRHGLLCLIGHLLAEHAVLSDLGTDSPNKLHTCQSRARVLRGLCELTRGLLARAIIANILHSRKVLS
ncbi:hypothetical protein J1N35_024950 [Gossypium stocksii]|uniref:Secreted protein n=1 Tax=Gossypium stocksii TaxID=47602 RepID=A0A9D3V5M8_9ROSI|nr:hypothetical protein J1N35_024950 [Gossypium stocksii]